jgi:hypothetical protein
MSRVSAPWSARAKPQAWRSINRSTSREVRCFRSLISASPRPVFPAEVCLRAGPPVFPLFSVFIISYCHGQYELVKGFIYQLKTALKAELETLMQEDLYIDEEHRPGYHYNEALARAICESV